MGWHLAVPPRVDADNGPNMRFGNYPMQANGSEMLQDCSNHGRGSRNRSNLAPIHDALLIQSSIEDIDDRIAQATMKIMGDASEFILHGFRLRSDVEIVRYPDRYFDERGERCGPRSWISLLEEMDPGGAVTYHMVKQNV